MVQTWPLARPLSVEETTCLLYSPGLRCLFAQAHTGNLLLVTEMPTEHCKRRPEETQNTEVTASGRTSLWRPQDKEEVGRRHKLDRGYNGYSSSSQAWRQPRLLTLSSEEGR